VLCKAAASLVRSDPKGWCGCCRVCKFCYQLPPSGTIAMAARLEVVARHLAAAGRRDASASPGAHLANVLPFVTCWPHSCSDSCPDPLALPTHRCTNTQIWKIMFVCRHSVVKCSLSIHVDRCKCGVCQCERSHASCSKEVRSRLAIACWPWPRTPVRVRVSEHASVIWRIQFSEDILHARCIQTFALLRDTRLQ
jgi:hypothetical protein